MFPDQDPTPTDARGSQTSAEEVGRCEIRRVIGERIVLTIGVETPYKVVLQYLEHEATEHHHARRRSFYPRREYRDSTFVNYSTSIII